LIDFRQIFDSGNKEKEERYISPPFPYVAENYLSFQYVALSELCPHATGIGLALAVQEPSSIHSFGNAVGHIFVGTRNARKRPRPRRTAGAAGAAGAAVHIDLCDIQP
jgi:predicted GNAT superfamily acetyltransferase